MSNYQAPKHDRDPDPGDVLSVIIAIAIVLGCGGVWLLRYILVPLLLIAGVMYVW